MKNWKLIMRKMDFERGEFYAAGSYFRMQKIR